ncbi:MAG: DNA polymerase I [Pirellulales bacterium]
MPVDNYQRSFTGWSEPAAEGQAENGSEAAAPSPQQPSIAGWRVYVIDGHSLIFQVFHALPDMTSPRGEHVNAVYGFVRDILQIIEQKEPDAIICALDPPGPTFRDQIYDRYKADRGSMPEELVGQIPKIEQVLHALAIPVISRPGFEADDVLATMARLCDEGGAECLLVSGDKDCRQLITDRVAVYNIRKDEVFDAEALAADWGIRPEQVVDFQALVGDKVDNVPGVPTIGPKTAQTWLEQYSTLDNLLVHASEIPGAKGQKLVEGRESALLSRELARLDSDVPIVPDWNAGRVGGFDHQRLSELFAEFGFRSLGERFAKLGGQPVTADASWDAEYQIVDTPAKLAELVNTLSQQSLISVDTETTHIMPRWAEIVGYSFAWAPGKAAYVPVRGPAGETVLDPVATVETLRPILENSAIAKIGQNLKYDMIVLRSAGVRLAGTTFDTMVASYLLDAGERNHNLDDMASRYLNHTNIKISELIGKGKNQKRMDEVPIAQVGPYAAEDADVPLRLKPLLEVRLDEMGLEKLNETVEVPLIAVLADMEFEGIRVEPARLAELSDRYGARLKELEIEIEELAGHPLNIASPKQLAQVLFQELKLPVIKKTKTGPSTDADVLEELADRHPLPAKIIEHRQFAKLKNTYVDALPAMIHPTTGRVHTSFNQIVAATGRLSSSDPNLQNIPIRTEEGREIRSAFVAGRPGWKLLAADYSQIELRILAHLSEDPALCEAFARDEDIHTLVASQVFGVEQAEVTSEMRRKAKAVNFGIIYGQSSFGLAKSLDISQEEAAAFIDAYFARYSGVGTFFADTLAQCSRQEYVSTMLGRRRAIQGVRMPEGASRVVLDPGRGGGPPGSPNLSRPLNLPERTAVNTVIQGSAADMIKLAMIAIARRLRDERRQSKMLLQIHDELVFEVPADELDAVAKLVTHEMQTVLPLRVPVKVDVKSGLNWSECEPWTA